MDANMNQTPLATGPPACRDQLLQDKLIEDIAGQGARMDDLAHRLIALDWPSPASTRPPLKLVAGGQGMVSGGVWLSLTFTCWGLAAWR